MVLLEKENISLIIQDLNLRIKSIGRNMKLMNNSYNGYKEEYFQMRDLLIESIKHSEKPLNWLIGRLDNWRYSAFTDKIKEDPEYYQNNAHLWRNDEGKLIGYFIIEDGKNYFDVQIDPQYRSIEKDIYSWIVKNLAEKKKKLITSIYSWDENRIKLVSDLGFINKGPLAVDFRYDTEFYLNDLEIGEKYHFETFSDNYNYKNHIETQRLAFGRTKDQLSREWFETKCMAPGYSSDWDFIVVDNKGEHLAFCLAWLDPENMIAELDPVGTHPDHRRKGLAKAVINNCFVKLRNNGINKAQVLGFTDLTKGLYRSLKPVEEYEILQFTYE